MEQIYISSDSQKCTEICQHIPLWLNHETNGQYMKTFMFSFIFIQYSLLYMYDSKKCFVNRCYEVNIQYNFFVSIVVFEVIKSYCVVCCIMSKLRTEGLSLLLLISIAWFMLIIGQHKKLVSLTDLLPCVMVDIGLLLTLHHMPQQTLALLEILCLTLQ
jgi:hypothetical protein